MIAVFLEEDTECLVPTVQEVLILCAQVEILLIVFIIHEDNKVFTIPRHSPEIQLFPN